jgi:hypothetical protein
MNTGSGNSVSCPALCPHFTSLLRQDQQIKREKAKKEKETVNGRRVTVIAGGSAGR